MWCAYCLTSLKVYHEIKKWYCCLCQPWCSSQTTIQWKVLMRVLTAGWQTAHCVPFPKMLGMWSPERMTRRNIKPSSCEWDGVGVQCFCNRSNIWVLSSRLTQWRLCGTLRKQLTWSDKLWLPILGYSS